MAVPEPVRRAYKRGWSVVPQSPQKRVIVKWSMYRRQQPSRQDVIGWHARWPDCRWAVVTGYRSIIVLDFDGEAGMATMKQLGLHPIVRTPHGGAHVWITGVRWSVAGGARVHEAKFPGLDIRADGQVATFHGQGYQVDAKGQAYTFEDLPVRVRNLLRRRRQRKRRAPAVPIPDDFSDQTLRQILLGEALARLATSSRNETGFWLATQLRDERYPKSTIMKTLTEYADHVSNLGDHPYTWQEAYNSVVSALTQPARLPRMLRDGAGITLLSEVEIEQVSWLWTDRVPMRKVTIIEGDPERFKSTMTLDLAARVSRGAPMPGGEKATEPGSVIVICAEDEANDTVKPRLLAAGADEQRIAFINLEKDERGNIKPLSIPEDLSHIRQALRTLSDRAGVPVKLVIIDPITAYLSERIHYGNDPQVRKAMWPLKQLAEETGVACLLVRHLNKDGNLRAMYRGGGSVAFGAAARSVLVVERHPDREGVMVLASVKGNLARSTPALTFHAESDPRYAVPKITWGEAIDIDVDNLVRGADSRTDAPARREAEDFLRELLADGPRSAKEVERAAKEAGLSMRTVKNAKKEMRIKSTKVANEKGQAESWCWILPVYVEGTKVHYDLS